MNVQIANLSAPELLPHALAYSADGISVIPIGNEKKPAIRGWKEYQARRADERQIRQWFATGKGIQGIGIVCGSVSGNLAVRDYDESSAYDGWRASHPELAAALPTVRTSRGYHVYFRLAQVEKTQTFDDGELRGEGAYVLAPPSRHPSGCVYQWLNPLGGEIPVVMDLNQLGLLQNPNKNSELKQSLLSSSVHSVLSVPSVLSVTCSDNDLIENAIIQTQPTAPGQRHRQVFKLARALKGITATANQPPGILKPIVKRWHERALPFINTKGFDETWSDFVNAWPNVKYALGDSPMDSLIERLQMLPPPPEAGQYDTTGVRLLVALCVELQRQAGKGPFFLDARTAGRLLEVEPMTAWRWLQMLKTDDLLAEVVKGRPRHATRWRWIGPSAEPAASELRG